MNRGLFTRTFYEIWAAVLMFAAALCVVKGLLSYVIPTLFAEYSDQLLQIEFVQRIIAGLLGADLGGQIGPTTVRSFTWVHPVVLAIVWAQAIALCTRVPAGEIDRGTVDLLIALPVSRWRLFACEAVMWLASGVLLLAAALFGNCVGGLFVAPEFRGSLGLSLSIAANLFCVYAAVGGMVCLVSAASDRRGTAVGVAVGIVLASFLLNFLAQFWPPARQLEALSVLHYYRPLEIVRTAAWPLVDMLILIATTVVLWAVGAIIFVRRDIRTV
jgi:ABC-type transport system involved in multi-copper enzyme maturation permease subunit